MNSIYTDGIANISITDNVVRLDLVRIKQSDGVKTEIEKVSSIAMSVAAFLRTHEVLNNAVKEMEAKGLITKKTPANKASTTSKKPN